MIVDEMLRYDLIRARKVLVMISDALSSSSNQDKGNSNTH